MDTIDRENKILRGNKIRNVNSPLHLKVFFWQEMNKCVHVYSFPDNTFSEIDK